MGTPFTKIRTSHALSIKAGGRIIGRIQTWNPSQGRDVKPKFEINAVGVGNPTENIPGIASSLTIQVSRYDLYLEKMEEVWGTPRALHMLTDQFNPIDIEEKWVRFGSSRNPLVQSLSKWNTEDGLNFIGNSINNDNLRNALDLGNSTLKQGSVADKDSNGKPVEVYIEKNWYSGCWFTSLGRTLSATGDRIVNVNATLVYTKIRPLL